jgi:hypothetical protein
MGGGFFLGDKMPGVLVTFMPVSGCSLLVSVQRLS